MKWDAVYYYSTVLLCVCVYVREREGGESEREILNLLLFVLL